MRFRGFLHRRRPVAQIGLLLVAASWLAQGLAEPRTPLPWGAGTELSQRVLVLPGARLMERPDAASRVLQARLPVFEVFYVYGRQGDWVEVGRKAQGPPDGWIAEDKVQEWSIMLVMQYAAPGQRERVLFFEKRETLQELLLQVDATKRARRLLREVDTGRHAGTGVIAVEQQQEGYVSFDTNPYLMPILGSRREEFDDGTPTRLVKVAGVNAQSGKAATGLGATSGSAAGEGGNGKALARARRAIVFVIDTTSSMGPYIERAREAARRIHRELGEVGLLENTAFGLVGYRNNMDQEPQRSRLEYVTRTFLPLDPAAPAERLLQELERMQPATVSTHSWDEDTVAGLYEALWEMDWKPFRELRMVILITDAGALRGNDPKARHSNKNIDLWVVRQKAMQDDIVLLPIHLLTPEAKRAGNIATARQQYAELGYTGDTNVSKYIGIEAGSVQDFAAQLDQLAGELGTVAKHAAQGVAEAKPELQRFQGGFTLGSLFRNEVYSAQQRYLGEVKGGEAALFFPSWAADKDLTQPRYTSLRVGVFLTRNQFNGLAKSLSDLVERAELAKESPQTFFARLQALAMRTSTDPQKRLTGLLRDSRVLPAYLKLLPYKSRVLSLTREVWDAMSAPEQLAFMDELRRKLTAYEQINADQRKWKDLGAGDPGLEVFPVPLDVLP
jgi:serine/threonine-protein kinase PpkA